MLVCVSRNEDAWVSGSPPLEFEAVGGGRRSIRGYRPDPVRREVIEEVL